MNRKIILIAIITTGVSIMALTESCTSVKQENTPTHDSVGLEMPRENVVNQDTEIMDKMSLKEQLEMYWKFFFEKAEKTPDEPLPQQNLDPARLLDSRPDSLKAAWLGHSSVLINIDGYVILTDPVFERKVSPIGPTRFNEHFPLDIEHLSSVDIVLISHDHYDHLNKLSIKQLADKTDIFIVPLGVGARLTSWGVAEQTIVEMNWWDEIQPLPGLTIAATPAQHFSGRGLFDRNETLWASWVIKTKNHRLFFSGDTGYFDGFREIGDKYGPFDLVFLECGAYNERWSNIHMLPEQTVQAFIDLGGTILQPIHWATFNLALHPWYEPMDRLTAEAWKQDVRVSTPVRGRVVDYAEPIITDRWWAPAMERSRKNQAQPQMTAHLSRQD
jgi:L-ascorbate metabolism protein UlaG (beta-lactamase superfamily)